MEEHERKQREREQLVKEADEKCDRMEAEARGRSEASRLRAQRDVSERAKMVAERERKRVEEGYYDPHRLSEMQEERKRRQAIERDKQAAARHEANSIARYIAAQNERDRARSASDERNERLRRERMQRLIEMQTDEEIDRMEEKEREDRRRWEADRWRRDVRWAWGTVTSKWTAYLAAVVFVVAFTLASVEVDTVEHRPRPVVRKYYEYPVRLYGGGAEGSVDGDGDGDGAGAVTGEGAGAGGAAAAEEGGEGGENIAASIYAAGPGPEPWKAKYRWVSPQRAAGKLLPSFITSGAAYLYKNSVLSSSRTGSGKRKRRKNRDGTGERNYVHGFDIAEMEGLGLEVETREGKAYLESALEPHLAVDDPKEMRVHQKLLMNLVNRGAPLSPPPRSPPPRPPHPPGPGDDPNIKATLKYLRGTHAKPLDFKDDRSADPVAAPVTRGMAAISRALTTRFQNKTEVERGGAERDAESSDTSKGSSAMEESSGGGEADDVKLDDGNGVDAKKSPELMYDDGIDPSSDRTAAAARGDGVVEGGRGTSDPADPVSAAKQYRKEAKARERETKEEAKRVEIARAQADAEELRSAVVEELTGARGVPLRNRGGVKFNAFISTGIAGAAAAAAKDSARTPEIVEQGDQQGGAVRKQKKKKRGFF